jgi:hypothetical protein
MRKTLIIPAILVALLAAMSIAWVFGGRQLSMFLDRFGTIEVSSQPVKLISYEGSGTGGILRINDLALGLATANPQGASPEIGTTKDDQLAVSFGGKVFPFGPLHSGTGSTSDTLATQPPVGDNAFIIARHSALSWPTPFDFNFMTGHSPSWKRHFYRQLLWKKESGAKLEMLWRYEQYFYPGNGWTSGQMTRGGLTGLISVDISTPVR